VEVASSSDEELEPPTLLRWAFSDSLFLTQLLTPAFQSFYFYFLNFICTVYLVVMIIKICPTLILQPLI
jgi:hypothetical protein